MMTFDWGEIDKLGAVLTLAVAAIFLPLQLFVSSIFARSIPVALGAASILYLLTSARDLNASRMLRWRLSASAAHVVRLSTAVGLAALILIATVTGGRTVPFLLAASMVGTLLLVQVFFEERNSLRPAPILAQVVVFALVVRGTGLVMTPGLIGVDSWVHITDYARSIRQAGSLSAISDVKYFAAPIYHLFVVVAAEVFQTSLRTALYATFGLVVPLSVLLIYFLVRHFLAIRWALFATVTYGLLDHFVRWGIHIIPTSLGLVFFISVCYFLAKAHATRNSIPLYGFALLFSFATIFTHQISSFLLLLIIGSGVVAQLYFRLFDPRTVTLNDGEMTAGSEQSVNFAAMFLVLLPVTVLNWSLAPTPGNSSFLEGILGVAQLDIAGFSFLSVPSSTSVSTGPVESLLIDVPVQYQLLDALGLLILLVFTLIGAFAGLHRHRSDVLMFVWITSTASMLFATLGLPLLDLSFFIPTRWYAFMYVPMIVLVTYGLRYLSLRASGRKVMVLLVIFALVLPGTMLLHYKATPDNPVNKGYHDQFAYTQSELNAAETIASIHPDGTTLSSDHPYRLLFRDWQLEDTSILNVTESRATNDEYTVYRRSQTSEGVLVLYKSEAIRVRLPKDSVCRPDMDVLYSNDEVTYCRS